MTNRSIDMLKTALSMEEKGKAFYEKVASESKNKFGREMFLNLMADEVVHVDRIKSIYESLNGKGKWSDEWTKFHANHPALDSMFSDIVEKNKQNVKADASDLAALDVGIDLETKSIKFYEDNLKQSTDPAEKTFLQKMIWEEKNHHEVLTDMKFYLSDPAGWFAEKEKVGLDG